MILDHLVVRFHTLVDSGLLSMEPEVKGIWQEDKGPLTVQACHGRRCNAAAAPLSGLCLAHPSGTGKSIPSVHRSMELRGVRHRPPPLTSLEIPSEPFRRCTTATQPIYHHSRHYQVFFVSPSDLCLLRQTPRLWECALLFWPPPLIIQQLGQHDRQQ